MAISSLAATIKWRDVQQKMTACPRRAMHHMMPVAIAQATLALAKGAKPTWASPLCASKTGGIGGGGMKSVTCMATANTTPIMPLTGKQQRGHSGTHAAGKIRQNAGARPPQSPQHAHARDTPGVRSSRQLRNWLHLPPSALEQSCQHDVQTKTQQPVQAGAPPNDGASASPSNIAQSDFTAMMDYKAAASRLCSHCLQVGCTLLQLAADTCHVNLLRSCMQ